MTVSSDKGGPGNIRWLSHEKGKDRELKSGYQQLIGGCNEQCSLRGNDHSSLCGGYFLGQQMRLSTAKGGELDGCLGLLLNLCFQREHLGDGVGTIRGYYER